MSLILREVLLLSGPQQELDRFERHLSIREGENGKVVHLDVKGLRATGVIEEWKRAPQSLELTVVCDELYFFHAYNMITYWFPQILFGIWARAIGEIGESVEVLLNGRPRLKANFDDDDADDQHCERAWQVAKEMCAAYAVDGGGVYGAEAAQLESDP